MILRMGKKKHSDFHNIIEFWLSLSYQYEIVVVDNIPVFFAKSLAY